MLERIKFYLEMFMQIFGASRVRTVASLQSLTPAAEQFLDRDPAIRQRSSFERQDECS